MSIAKVIEVTAASKESFEDAIRDGIDRTCKTVEDVQGAWVKQQKVLVEKGQIVEYRVDLKITFLLRE